MFAAAAERFVDGGRHESGVTALAERWRRRGMRVLTLTIDPLAAGWDTPIEPDHFRSGCAPLEALAAARERLDRDCDLVLIEGVDPIRSAFARDREARERLMRIYGDGLSIPEAYTRLAEVYLRNERIAAEDFERFARALFANFQRTARSLGMTADVPAGRFDKVTPLFRAVDCANPSVDFEGRVLLAAERVMSRLGEEAPHCVEVLSMAVEQAPGDGPTWVDEIAAYGHLGRAFRSACDAANVDVVAEFLEGRALLEVYSCFPIVPLAFLMKCGFASSIGEAEALLARREVSVTGGMNLGRAPWNAPVLNAMVVMLGRMTARGTRWGVLHGNGGLGWKQGVAVLGLRTGGPGTGR